MMDSGERQLMGIVFILAGLYAWGLGCGVDPAYAQDGQDSQTRRTWTFALYGGRWVDEGIDKILMLEASASTDSYLLAAAIAREFYQGKRFRFEWEGQIVQHVDAMDHMEFNALATVRLPMFLKSPIWDMSLALGGGLSLATQTPELEELREGVEDPSPLLFYMLLEYTLGLGNKTPWDLMFRVHHRSGGAGILGDNRANYLCLGLKFYF
jgi:hypothetical protein